MLGTFADTVHDIDSFLWGWPLIVVLMGAGLYMTFRLRFLQIRGLKHGVGLLSGKYDDPNDPGEISHFQALSAALSATIGIGNIAGVATAIHMGGPGALFWMWVTAIVNAPLKYAGICLSHKYRTIHPDGEASGGPMYYLSRGLGIKWLAVGFAVFTAIAAFGIGNMVQSNTVAEKLSDDLDIPAVATGIVLALLLGLVIIGGIRRIAKVTSKLVPVMCLVYVLSAVALLVLHVELIPGALKLIFHYAFHPVAIAGGFAGTLVRYTLEYGVKRGLFSNESGLGSASIAHAAARTKEPVREGLVGQLGPFIDTLILCTMTGLVIVVTGAWKEKVEDTVELSDVSVYATTLEGKNLGEIEEMTKYTGTVAIIEGLLPENLTVFRDRGTIDDAKFMVDVGTDADVSFTGELDCDDGTLEEPELGDPDHELGVEGKVLATGAVLTGLGFKIGLGDWAGYVVTLSVLLFAFSTAITWSYYGDRSMEFLFGRRAILPYRVVFVLLYFLGAILTLELVWDFADIANGLMAFPNLIGLVLMSGVLARITKDYFDRRKA